MMPNIIQRLKDAYSENSAKALELLPELFKAAEEGKIVELPCKVGDTVWVIDNKKIIISAVTKIIITVTQIHFEIVSHSIMLKYLCEIEDFGKTVFLTREAAEKALEDKNETNIV